jgi:phage shock protein A
LDRRREDLRQEKLQCEERLASLEIAFEQIRSLIAYVERVRNKQLVANVVEAAKLYPTVDTEPQLVEALTSAVEKMEKQTQQFHSRWSAMSPEQRQKAEARWDKQQVSERLRSMTINEKQQLFDALGLKAEWTRHQPLRITLAIPYATDNGPSGSAARNIRAALLATAC